MFALSFFILLSKCLMKGIGRTAMGYMVGYVSGGCLLGSVSSIWCSSLPEDNRNILSG